jgi:hypothetical protein
MFTANGFDSCRLNYLSAYRRLTERLRTPSLDMVLALSARLARLQPCR